VARLEPDTIAALKQMLADEGLAGLVAPRLPLDLTPMATESAYLRAAEILLRRDAAVLVLGAVPFTRRLHTDGSPAQGFARALAELSVSFGKPIGVAVDAGAGYEAYRDAFDEAGLAVFTRIEAAVLGLRTLTTPYTPSAVMVRA
jgi:acyl-CoA synthetase (NDP forming)